MRGDARPASEAARFEGIGRVAGGVAHDLNNMLCGVLGGLELALDELEPGHPAREDLELVQRKTREAVELCRQLLTHARPQCLAVEPVDLAALITSMEKLLRIAAGKNVALRLDLASGMPPLNVDSAQFRHLLITLVGNVAAALGGAAATITVRLGRSGRDGPGGPGEPSSAEPSQPEHVFLEVSDNGPGLAAPEGGDLSVVRGIVDAHVGTFAVRHVPGAGSSFWIRFPVAPAAIAAREPQDRVEAWTGRGLVLLVDDEPLVRAVGGSLLERLGFEVVTAEDGQAALDVFERLRASIVLVVLDLSMPTLGGEATLRELRRRAPGVPVVLTSGYGEVDAIRLLDGEGPTGFIQKPFRLEQLRMTLTRALAGAGLERSVAEGEVEDGA